jgi:hypothetical protein
LDIGVLCYIGIVWPKEHSPEVRSFPPGTPCIITLLCHSGTALISILKVLPENVFVSCFLFRRSNLVELRILFYSYLLLLFIYLLLCFIVSHLSRCALLRWWCQVIVTKHVPLSKLFSVNLYIIWLFPLHMKLLRAITNVILLIQTVNENDSTRRAHIPRLFC